MKKKAKDLEVGDFILDRGYCYEVASKPNSGWAGVIGNSTPVLEFTATLLMPKTPQHLGREGETFPFQAGKEYEYKILTKEWLQEAWHNEAKMFETVFAFQNLRHVLEERFNENQASNCDK